MRLGIVADEISKNFREAVRIGVEAGLRRYEIRFLESGRIPTCDASELREIERIRDGEAIEITAISPGLFKWTNNRQAFAREMSEVFPRAAEIAQRWNLPALVTFGFHKPGATEENFCQSETLPNEVVEMFAEAAEAAEAAGLQLWIEPEPVCQIDTATRAVELIKKVGSNALRVNYDAGNVAWLTGIDPIDEFETAAPYIANVHVKDLLEMRGGKAIWTTPGAGLIDYAAHFARLRRANFDGVISLEPHFPLDSESLTACVAAVEEFWAAAQTTKATGVSESFR